MGLFFRSSKSTASQNASLEMTPEIKEVLRIADEKISSPFPKDVEKAIAQYMLCLDFLSASKLYDIYCISIDKEKVDVNRFYSLRLLKKAAEKGHTEAATKLAQVDKQDLTKVALAEKAIARSNEEKATGTNDYRDEYIAKYIQRFDWETAQTNLGLAADFYMMGMAEMAYSLMCQSAYNGDALGHYLCGIIHNEGIGCNANADKALDYFEQAARLGHMEASATAAHIHSKNGNREKAKIYLDLYEQNKALALSFTADEDRINKELLKLAEKNTVLPSEAELAKLL